MKRPGPPSPSRSPSLQGRRVAGGVWSCEQLRRLLGIDDPELHCEVIAVAWIEDHMDLSLRAGTETFTLAIEARSAAGPAYLNTEHLRLWFQGAHVPAEVDRALRGQAPERLGALTLDALRELLSADPELGRPGLSFPSHDDYDSPTRGHLHSWGGTEVFADFFAGAELIRHQLDSLDLFTRITCIQHSDPECMCVAPVHGAPIVSLVNFPWVDRHRRYGRRGEPAPFPGDAAGAPPPAMYTTALTEKDVLLGNPDKLERVLERAVADPQGGMILFSNTCVPVVTGEDVESAVRRHRRQSPVPLLFLTVTSPSMRDVLSEVLVRRRLEAEAEAEPPDPQAVNLIGFPKDHATAELCSLLGEAGVRVNEILIPSIAPDAVARLARAALNVYWPNTLWQHLYDQLQKESRTAAIAPPAPFGMEGTRRWLQAVGDAVGRGPAVARVAEDALALLAPRWRALQQRASERRLCFVARSSQLELLTEAARSWGVPLLETVQELGFALDVIIHVRGRESARKSAHTVHRMLRNAERHRIQAFETPAQLQRRLAETEAQAVFSQHFFDWRVTTAGKVPFSLMHFEHGLSGAVLTLERLLGLCDTPFYRRLRRYLGRTLDGRRIGPGDAERPEPRGEAGGAP